MALGESRTAATTIAVTMGSAVGTGVVARKLADLRAEAEAELAWRASHDGLTGLANRSALIREVARPAGRGRAGPSACWCSTCAGSSRSTTRWGTCPATPSWSRSRSGWRPRAPGLPLPLGGDEFAVLLPGAGQDEALQHAHRVSGILHDRYEVDGLVVPLGATVGVATHVWSRRVPDADSDAPAGDRARALSALLAAADEAMYHARVLRSRVATAEQVGALERRTGRRPVA